MLRYFLSIIPPSPKCPAPTFVAVVAGGTLKGCCGMEFRGAILQIPHTFLACAIMRINPVNIRI